MLHSQMAMRCNISCVLATIDQTEHFNAVVYNRQPHINMTAGGGIRPIIQLVLHRASGKEAGGEVGGIEWGAVGLEESCGVESMAAMPLWLGPASTRQSPAAQRGRARRPPRIEGVSGEMKVAPEYCERRYFRVY